MTTIEKDSQYVLQTYGRFPLALAKGQGTRVWDEEGREYLDFCAGIATCSLGHCHPALVAAISDQAGRLMQTTNLFYTLPQLDLVERLGALTPDAITRSFLVSSGTEAMESHIIASSLWAVALAAGLLMSVMKNRSIPSRRR